MEKLFMPILVKIEKIRDKQGMIFKRLHFTYYNKDVICIENKKKILEKNVLG